MDVVALQPQELLRNLEPGPGRAWGDWERGRPLQMGRGPFPEGRDLHMRLIVGGCKMSGGPLPTLRVQLEGQLVVTSSL